MTGVGATGDPADDTEPADSEIDGEFDGGELDETELDVTGDDMADEVTDDDPTDDDVTDDDVGEATDEAPVSPEEQVLLDVGAFIRSQRERTEMSLRRLAELADVSNPYLSQVERGLRKPSAEILQQVAQALRISVESLYVRAGILPDADRRVSTVPEAIEHDRYLSDEQKQALLGVYASFVDGV